MDGGAMANAFDTGLGRRTGRDCRNPEAMEGSLHSPPCVLDTGNPCRYDGCVNLIGGNGGLLCASSLVVND